tara:strand:- start:1216 stop:1767 length:552 start_codon:yes stop_codon:yes gene_type:complete
MLVLRFHKVQFYFTFFFIFFYSCEDVNYQLDNEFDPENLNLIPPTIFFHPSQFKSIEVGSSDTLELYCYDVQNAAGAHLQIEFDAEIVSIDTVLYGGFFMNGVNSPIMFTDQEDGFLNIYLFLQPTLGISDASGTTAMAKLIFSVRDEGLAPIRYTTRTSLRDKNNYPIQLNQYGEALINATN